MRKEKNKEAVLDDSVLTPAEPVTAVPPPETKPLVAQDKVPSLRQQHRVPEPQLGP